MNCPYSEKPCEYRSHVKELETGTCVKTRKILINDDYGGYDLSKVIHDELGGIKWDGDEILEYRRDDPDLIRAVEKLGEKKSSGPFASLKIVEIPADVEWIIQSHFGREWIAEKHRTWGWQ
jgi:hypothetical protein